MGARVEVDFRGPSLESLRRAMNLTLTRVKDKHALADEIGSALVASTKARFRTQRAPDGQPWEPSQRVKNGTKDGKGAFADKTLVLSGMLRRSITHAIGRSHIEVGTNLVYGRVHQHGFSGIQAIRAHTRYMVSAFGRRLTKPKTVQVKAHRRQMNIVARPYLGLSERDKASIRKILRRELGSMKHAR